MSTLPLQEVNGDNPLQNIIFISRNTWKVNDEVISNARERIDIPLKFSGTRRWGDDGVPAENLIFEVLLREDIGFQRDGSHIG